MNITSAPSEKKPTKLFVTDDPNLKRIVTFSEPPAHDKLQENHNRLIEIYGQDGSDFIRLTLGQIREKCRDFQAALAQVKRTRNNDALSFLDDLLGPLIKPRKSGPPKPPEPSSRAPTIQKSQQTVTLDGVSYTKLSLELGLSEETEFDEVDFILDLSCAVVRDDNHTTDKLLEVLVGSDDSVTEQLLKPGEKLPVTLQKREKLSLWAKAEIHPSWRAQWGILLDKAESN